MVLAGRQDRRATSEAGLALRVPLEGKLTTPGKTPNVPSRFRFDAEKAPLLLLQGGSFNLWFKCRIYWRNRSATFAKAALLRVACWKFVPAKCWWTSVTNRRALSPQ